MFKNCSNEPWNSERQLIRTDDVNRKYIGAKESGYSIKLNHVLSLTVFDKTFKFTVFN